MLKAGIDLGLFTAIGGGAGTPAAIAAACQATEHGVGALCDSLTVMGLLTKSGGAYASARTRAFSSIRSRRPIWVAWPGF